MDKTDNIETAKTKFINTVYRVLLAVTAAMVLVIIIFTVAGFACNSDTPLFTIGKTDKTQPHAEPVQEGDIRVFSGIGRLRIPLADSGVLILSIAFPYQASDIAFTEELAGKIPEFKTIAADYFTNLPQERQLQINEEAAKTEILARYNAILRLGKISALYFNDMMLLDIN